MLGWRCCLTICPRLQREEIRKVTPAFPSLYLGRDIKKAFPGEEKKTLFTRAVGALLYPGGCYAVYNARNAAMKWRGMGEFKALHSLSEVARLNGGVERLDVALLLGQSYQVALETLVASQQERREFRFDGIYPHIHFLPLDGFGARLLGLLIQPYWQERLLDLLFEPADRTFGRGAMEYDAQVEGVKIFSHLDGDIARLLRFKEALWGRPGKFEVLCFPPAGRFCGGVFRRHGGSEGDTAGCGRRKNVKASCQSRTPFRFDGPAPTAKGRCCPFFPLATARKNGGQLFLCVFQLYAVECQKHQHHVGSGALVSILESVV